MSIPIWRLAGIALSVFLLAGCGSKPSLLYGPPPPSFPENIPRRVVALTLLGDQTINDTVTDELALGLARLGFYPVKRIVFEFEEGEEEEKIRQVASLDEITQAMWYYGMIDSASRMTEWPSDAQIVVVGSFTGLADVMGENEEKVMPTGILQLRMVNPETLDTIWQTTVQDRRLFPVSMDLRESARAMIGEALYQLQVDWGLVSIIR